jgi:hypothetical protein
MGRWAKISPPSTPLWITQTHTNILYEEVEKMKKIFICLILAFFAFVEESFAGGPYYVNFSFTVQPTNEFWVSGDPPSLILDSILPGDPSAEVSDESTTWSFSSNEWIGYKKVTVESINLCLNIPTSK